MPIWTGVIGILVLVGLFYDILYTSLGTALATCLGTDIFPKSHRFSLSPDYYHRYKYNGVHDANDMPGNASLCLFYTFEDYKKQGETALVGLGVHRTHRLMEYS